MNEFNNCTICFKACLVGPVLLTLSLLFFVALLVSDFVHYIFFERKQKISLFGKVQKVTKTCNLKFIKQQELDMNV